MPQADPDLVRKLEEYFGEDCHGQLDFRAQEYLRDQGYKEDRFRWHPKPGVKTVDDMTQKEYDCLWYLITEWDWGGLINEGS